MSDLFSSASAAWSRMSAFRADRARCKRYVYGEQWDDPMFDGQHMTTEREYILRHGQIPLKNNILRRIIRNVTGLYRAQYKVPLLSPKESGLRGKALREINDARRRWFHENSMEEFAPRLLEEFLISGIVAVKVIGRDILPVTPDNFFFHSDGYDPRGRDVDMIGEVHQVSFGTLLDRFCHSADDYSRISEVYGAFMRGADGCRLLEVWTKETRFFSLRHDSSAATLHMNEITESENVDSGLRTRPRASTSNHGRSFPKSGRDARLVRPCAGTPEAPLSALHSPLFTKVTWRPRWYAPDGTLLREGEPQESHPYVFKAYPFIDGEVHSYISDLIDQQRYVNRLITLYDFIMKSTAKGVLLFPDDCLPAGMDLQDVADEWSRFNGVIPIRAKPGVPLPTQVSGNAANIGITELLKVEMQMLEDISGVSPTLQGKLQTNSTSGTLFAQQNEAAQTSLLDILRSFTDFLSILASRIAGPEAKAPAT